MHITFCKDVRSFTSVLEQLRNPFLSMSGEHVAHETKNVIGPSVSLLGLVCMKMIMLFIQQRAAGTGCSPTITGYRETKG